MKKILIALSLIMVLASQASAGCAWILWGVSFGNDGRQNADHSAIMGYEKRGECLEALTRFEKMDGTAPTKPGHWEYTCLPDTINLKHPQ